MSRTRKQVVDDLADLGLQIDAPPLSEQLLQKLRELIQSWPGVNGDSRSYEVTHETARRIIAEVGDLRVLAFLVELLAALQGGAAPDIRFAHARQLLAELDAAGRDV